MKTMKQVFDGKPCGFSTRMTDEQVRYAQHAINCHDDLKAALQELMSSVGGGVKLCGHEFSCICATEQVRAALKKAESIQ